MITKERIKQKEEGERIQGALQRYFCLTFGVIGETSCSMGKIVCPSEQNFVVPNSKSHLRRRDPEELSETLGKHGGGKGDGKLWKTSFQQQDSCLSLWLVFS